MPSIWSINSEGKHSLTTSSWILSIIKHSLFLNHIHFVIALHADLKTRQPYANCTWLACTNRVWQKNAFYKKSVKLDKLLGYDNPKTNKSHGRLANFVSNIVNKPGVVSKIQLGVCRHSSMDTSTGYHKPNVEGMDCIREAVQDIQDDNHEVLNSPIINLHQSDSRTSPSNSYDSEEKIVAIGVMTQPDMEVASPSVQCKPPPFTTSSDFNNSSSSITPSNNFSALHYPPQSHSTRPSVETD